MSSARPRCSRRLRRRRLVSGRAAGPLQPELRPAVAAGAGGGAGGRLGPTCNNPYPQHHRARGRGALCLRRGAAHHRRLTRSRTGRRSTSSRAPAVGYAATEAPRGLLYHRYRLDDDGTIAEAHIVPPTSQNQPSIEEDLRDLCRRLARPRRRGAAASLRADGAQLRSVHLLRDAFPASSNGSRRRGA